MSDSSTPASVTPRPRRVGIAGVTGYSGRQCARLLARHPGFELVLASSDAYAGSRLSRLDPELGDAGNAVVVGHVDTVRAAIDREVELMFVALNEAARGDKVVAELIDAGVRVIDMTGAHRLVDPEAHHRAYGFAPCRPELNQEAIYGLTEWLDVEQSRAARLVANPGSIATAVLLALMPLMKAGAVDLDTLVVDAKVGTSAAGRSAQVSLLHSELYGNFYAYRIGRHPHIPEIAQAVETVGDASGAFTFVSHMLPVARGILVTCYIRVPGAQGARAATEQVHRLWQESYSQSPFMRVLGSAEDVQLSAVVGTNRCLLSAAADDYGDRVVVVSAIDNLLKGAAGQALENANLMVGYPRVWGHEGLG